MYKNYLIKTNADTQIWVTKTPECKMVCFSEYELDRINLKPDKDTLTSIGNFDEVVSNNVDVEIHPLDFSGVKVLEVVEL